MMEKQIAEKLPEGQLLTKSGSKLPIKAYKRRWWIMFVFMYYAGINALQWIEYSSITAIVVKYYNVSTLAVDWTSTVFMVVYPILVIPASYLIDKKGVRLAVLVGCTGTFIGTAIKVLSIRGDMFWLVLVGNTIVSASCLVIVCLPPKLASLWFQANEVSTACSLGVFGSQMGSAIGFVLPPFLVHDHDNLEDIGSNLKVLCWVLAIAMIPPTVAVFLYFPDEPPLPPSNVQAVLRENKVQFDTKVFFLSIKDLFLNTGFVIHLCGYGINIAVFSAIGTLLSQFILSFFEGANQEAGFMGFILIIAGMIAMLAFGILLDKTHKYKEIALFNYFFAGVSILCLMFALKYRLKIMTYVACILVGIFTNAYMMVGFEFGMELTFPAEESTTSGIMLASSQILGAIFTISLGYINLWLGPFWALSTQVVMMFIGTIATAFVPNDLRRQEAFRRNSPEYSVRKASYHGSRPMFIE
ncbi:unnamed protein product [Psylliodes chrysocephalus]|uniref:Major facilitator superfamily (MFS) profile domain-containing protein n=1 Tax=Psylliodes chrysocephalus TaxID=3402493 RepID=A0A9P0CHU5_9CUCU|nr:unnamed protein product [Psylliodes chrysocephala]